MSASAAAQPAGAPAATLYLHPGALAASARPLAVSTILGSCVGVCLFDAERGVGGMNHFLLPGSAGSARPTPRFGDVAMERLLAEVLQAGARRRRLAARVYGGACVLAAFRGPGDHLGDRNVSTALRFLEDERIPVLALDTGGRCGRRVVFHTWDGAAEARRI
ncbi:MAG TPA: chemotaxis protein CheD [Longimicrobium sp.]|nr:chemotaxis protein CheD [Longimicrobium sp.]